MKRMDYIDYIWGLGGALVQFALYWAATVALVGCAHWALGERPTPWQEVGGGIYTRASDTTKGVEFVVDVATGRCWVTHRGQSYPLVYSQCADLRATIK